MTKETNKEQQNQEPSKWKHEKTKINTENYDYFPILSFDCSGLWNDIYVISVLVVTQKAPIQPFALVFYDYQWKE